MSNSGKGARSKPMGSQGPTGRAVHPATPESRAFDDMPEVRRYIVGASSSDAAARVRAGIELRARQRALRAEHDRRRATGDPKVIAALDLAAKHHREAARSRRP